MAINFYFRYVAHTNLCFAEYTPYLLIILLDAILDDRQQSPAVHCVERLKQPPDTRYHDIESRGQSHHVRYEPGVQKRHIAGDDKVMLIRCFQEPRIYSRKRTPLVVSVSHDHGVIGGVQLRGICYDDDFIENTLKHSKNVLDHGDSADFEKCLVG